MMEPGKLRALCSACICIHCHDLYNVLQENASGSGILTNSLNTPASSDESCLLLHPLPQAAGDSHNIV